MSPEAARPQGRAAALDEVFARLRKESRVGLMTHIVFGYPTVEASRHLADIMVRSGVDLMEVQLPFSDPTADGPTITHACLKALDRGVRAADGLAFVSEAVRKHSVPILFMSYFNVVFNYHEKGEARRGIAAFARAAAQAGAAGLIIPDLPPEEDQERYPETCREHGLHPIYVTSPNVNDRRLEAIAKAASGFVYTTSRTGTTGREVQIAMDELGCFLDRAHRICKLPVAVGFSISKREQIEALSGKAEMAVVGSHLIQVYEKLGLSALEREIRTLAGRKD